MGRTRGRPRKSAAKKQPAKLSQRLVLNGWMLALFEAPKDEKQDRNHAFLDSLKRDLSPEIGGDWVGSDGRSQFVRTLTARNIEREHLPHDDLERYDANIVRYWREITSPPERRGHALQHFQYAALLFTEVYLDRYFRDEDGLLADLNAFVEQWNAERDAVDHAEPFGREDLNKLAFWMATGSGKTLLMHVNIKQYLHYLEAADKRHTLNRIILLTPNEGLSRQHLDEFAASGMEATAFQKDARTLFTGRAIEVIEVTKLADESGDKTVAVDAFEGNNLVLVDEGHRGSSGGGGGAWMTYRRRLCETGFSFEYSATFGQAISPSARALVQEYGHAILFDYSYRYFHTDGFGKHYQILNLREGHTDEQQLTYMTGGLLAYLQQLVVHRDQRAEFAPYLVEKPLWVFVGHTVRSTGKDEVSDIYNVLAFLADFVSNEPARHQRVLERIRQLRDGGRAHGLIDRNDRDLFHNRLRVVLPPGRDPEVVYREALRLIFNTEAGGNLYVEQVQGDDADGEIALRVASSPAFGVVNVGDPSKVLKQVDEHGAAHGLIQQPTGEFRASLFRDINSPASTVNVLIGAKKFTEGWSSWRVSTMGLMNVGRSEGSEIIQLFGRGVRLKGLGHALKRSSKLPGNHPRNLALVETLNIFGVRADYMDAFREYLKAEDLPTDEDMEEVTLRVVHHLAPGGKFEQLNERLWTLAVPDGVNFQRDERPVLTADLDDRSLQSLLDRKVVLDRFPRLQAEVSREITGSDGGAIEKEPQYLRADHIAFFDFDAIWFALQQHKAERHYYNLAIPRDVPRLLLERGDWYELFTLPGDLAFDRFTRVREWQEIAIALLKKFTDRFYELKRNEYLGPKLEPRRVEFDESGAGNFFAEYVFEISRDDHQLRDAISLVEEQPDVPRQLGALEAVVLDSHLYTPLIHLAPGSTATMKPVGLNPGERDFVRDLARFMEEHPHALEGREFYVLRNRSRGRGWGFFEGANVYPDFILWLVHGEKQHITFVDPHGLVHASKDDPKLMLARSIKDHEARIRETHPEITLDSFIVSPREGDQIPAWASDFTDADLDKWHLLFRDGSTKHIGKMFALMGELAEVG